MLALLVIIKIFKYAFIKVILLYFFVFFYKSLKLILFLK